MRRLGLILLALMVAATAAFGASGTWQCANGTRCTFTPGIGFHCPGIKTSPGRRSMPASCAGSMRSSCPLCRSEAAGKPARSSSPCASVCGKCQCRFVVTARLAPAVTVHHSGIVFLITSDHPAILPAAPSPAAGFAVHPLIFTTGPPGSVSASPLTFAPSRAPPRLLSA